MDFNTLLPPPEAYKYQPKPEEYKCKVGKQVIRRIFDTELDQDDNKALELFYAQAQPKDPIWTRPQVLRFLQANQFKIPQTLESMRLYEEWRKTLPIAYDQNVEQFLNSGICYISGRDRQFRPILVLNAYLINFNTMSLEVQTRGLTYLLEAVMNQMLIPGRVENWVIIVDLNGTGITGLYPNAIKQLMGYLQNNYRSRLYKMFVVRSTLMTNITWNLVRPFLEENTQEKIQFLKNDVYINVFQKMQRMQESINSRQLEMKYGGLVEDRKTYWPVVLDVENII